MRQQSPKSYRWTSMSAVTIVVLLGCSVGCVSLQHHARRHTIAGLVTENHHGRYYHCHHCGQIIPREGFYKCPRCFQVPAYHGYEPTCWRQWPQGWGCPPQSVANNPAFWAEGMVESDVMMRVDPAEAESGVQPLHAPQPDPAPAIPDSSRMELGPNTVASGNTVLKQPAPTAGPDNPPLPAPRQDVAATAPPVVTAETSAEGDSATPDPVVDAEPETPQLAQIVTPKPTPLIVEEPAADEAVTIAEVPLGATNEASVAAGSDTLDDQLATVPQPQVDDSQSITQPDAVLTEVADRTPMPTRKVELFIDPDDGREEPKDEAGPTSTPIFSLAQTQPPVIDATTTGALTQAATSATSIDPVVPRDAQGRIPVRKVRLEENELTESNRTHLAPAVATERSRQEEFPVPVNRIAVPIPAVGGPMGSPSLVPGEQEPLPVRRIRLSELPSRIQP